MTPAPSPDLLPEPITQWLRGLQDHVARAVSVSTVPPNAEAARLLRKAADCYSVAGWVEAAGQTFMRLGDHRRAAGFFERQELWDQAALAWTRAQDWEQAARCWQRGQRYEDAADCLHRAGHVIEAAWLVAHAAGRWPRSMQWLEGGSFPDNVDQVAVELVLARCDAGQRPRRTHAGRQLRSLLPRLAAVTDRRRHQLREWALAIADSLGRPDLTLLVNLTIRHDVLSTSPSSDSTESVSMDLLLKTSLPRLA
jgi:hypothetical protein